MCRFVVAVTSYVSGSDATDTIAVVAGEIGDGTTGPISERDRGVISSTGTIFAAVVTKGRLKLANCCADHGERKSRLHARVIVGIRLVRQ